MKTLGWSIAAVALLMAGAFASTYAADEITSKTLPHALAAIQSAKAVARAGKGTLLSVGTLMATEAPPSSSIVVIDEVQRSDLRLGMVLILAKLDCAPVDACLIARRITSVNDAKIETEPYPTIEGLLFTEIKASVIGAVAYSVDLNTNTIQDLHTGQAEPITLERAISQERRLISGIANPTGI